MARSRKSRVLFSRLAQLEAAVHAFQCGRYAEVLKETEQLVVETPRLAEAWHLRASAALGVGKYELAKAAFAKARRLAPHNLEIVLGAANFLIAHAGEERKSVKQGLKLCARGREAAFVTGALEQVFGFRLLEGIAYNQLGESELALESLDAALREVPHSVDAALERAIALFELCRFEEAEETLEALLARAPEEAWAHHYLGLLAERRGTTNDARRHFARARALKPENFQPFVHLTDREFDGAVEEALARLPMFVRRALEATLVVVEPFPSDADLRAECPPLSPSILGMFRGLPLETREARAEQQAATIVLYQRNLERFTHTRAELVEQIGITLMHEVGHFMGFEERDLWARGLE